MFHILSVMVTLLISSTAAKFSEPIASQQKQNLDSYVKLHVEMINFEPITKLQVGSQEDQISVIVDTGSSDFWVPSKQNLNCASADYNTTTSLEYQNLNWGHLRDTYYLNCSIYGTFDSYASTSLSYNKTGFSVIYSSFQYAYGDYVTDQISTNNLDLGKINFAVGNTSSEAVGVLGIGTPDMEYTYLKYNYTYANLPFQLVNNGLIKRPIYSIYLNETHGEFLFGAVDNAKYSGKLIKFPMINPLELGMYKIGAITLNTFSLSTGDNAQHLFEGFIPTVIDSGSPNTQLPQKIYDSVVKILSLQEIAEGTYVTDCSNLKDKFLVFNFHGVNFKHLMIDNFVKTSNNQCILNLSSTSNNYFVLGNKFMKQLYTVFDWEERSIAIASVNHSYASNIEALTNPVSADNPPNTATFGGSNTQFIQINSITTSSNSANLANVLSTASNNFTSSYHLSQHSSPGSLVMPHSILSFFALFLQLL